MLPGCSVAPRRSGAAARPFGGLLGPGLTLLGGSFGPDRLSYSLGWRLRH